MNFQSIIDRSKERGITEIEIYSGTNKGTAITWFNGNVDKLTVKDLEVVSIRGIFNGKMGYVTTEKCMDEEIDALLQRLIENALLIGTADQAFIFEGSSQYRSIPPRKLDFMDKSTAEKMELVRRLESGILKTDERIKQVSNCQYSETISEVRILNSKGLNLSKKDGYGFLMAAGVARTDSDVQSVFDYQIADHFDAFDPEKLGKEIAKETLAKLNGETVPSKSYSVVLKNRVVADLLNAFRPMFSGESLYKNLTLLKGKENETIMGENITIVDDPFLDEGLSKSSFDDEGVACDKLTLVDHGVFRSFMHNLKTANHFKTQSTGHGFKPSIYASVGIAPTNLYLERGTQSFESLFKTMSEGLLITEIEGLHAGIDPVSGSFSLKSSGFLIENGQIVRPVKLIVISGKFLEMLRQVESIADDLRFTYTGVGAPSIRIKEINVSGK